jgi:hypothetical protein
MSISKKLGGARLRFVVALAAVLGVVAAFSASLPLDPSFSLGSASVNGGDPVRVLASGLTANGHYYLVPVGSDMMGWIFDDAPTNAGTIGDPYPFDETTYSPAAIHLQASPTGTIDKWVATQEPGLDNDQFAEVELRVGSEDGSVVDEPAELTILSQL